MAENPCVSQTHTRISWYFLPGTSDRISWAIKFVPEWEWFAETVSWSPQRNVDMHREKQASVESYGRSRMILFFVKFARTIRMINVATKIIAVGSGTRERSLWIYLSHSEALLWWLPIAALFISYLPTYLTVSRTDIVFHGITSPWNNKNTHTNNPCPIRVLWSSSPWARFAVDCCATRVLGRTGEGMWLPSRGGAKKGKFFEWQKFGFL